MWSSFMSTFCKLRFACYAGAPNWLGWALLLVAVLFLLGIAWPTSTKK